MLPSGPCTPHCRTRLPPELLRRTEEKKEERRKERLDDYYRRNYGEYLNFQVSAVWSPEGTEAEGTEARALVASAQQGLSFVVPGLRLPPPIPQSATGGQRAGQRHVSQPAEYSGVAGAEQRTGAAV